MTFVVRNVALSFAVCMTVNAIGAGAADTKSSNTWIRGVNLGGWLVAERVVTPYLFALTSCHLVGDFCFYPNQLSAPPKDGTGSAKKHVYCDQYQCQPHLIKTADGRIDFPTDEFTLLSSFPHKTTAKEYMTIHWDNFVTKQDLSVLADVGVTHIRVPVPHYMFSSEEDEPWVNGQWLYLVRLCNWARKYKLQVWLSLQTAPVSQNGLDNSGQLLSDAPTCHYWDTSQQNINRTLRAIEDIAKAVIDDNIRDIVTGFGILNEPWADCNRTVLEKFSNDAFDLVRNIMGDNTHVFIFDHFNSSTWNNNGWWMDRDIHDNTYLDSHYYQLFGETERRLTPKQHIAYTCAKFQRGIEDCCYQHSEKNNEKRSPSEGMSRIVGEWSAAFDILPEERLRDVMTGIKTNFTASFLLREISSKRKEFMRNFVEAQMVTYENAGGGTSRGWFYWTLKMEGGAFAEWDFLRGIKEGWIPEFPNPRTSCESVFGTCRAIAKRTKDDSSVIEEFPDPSDTDRIGWPGPVIDDDYVMSHAESSSSSGDKSGGGDDYDPTKQDKKKNKRSHWFRFFAMLLFGYGVWHVYLKDQFGFGRRRPDYQPLHSTSLTI